MALKVRHVHDLSTGAAKCGETRFHRGPKDWWRLCRRCSRIAEAATAPRKVLTSPSPLSSDRALDEYLEELAEEEHSGR